MSFEDVALQYRPGLPMVLKGLSFQVQPGEKVRSGSNARLPWLMSLAL